MQNPVPKADDGLLQFDKNALLYCGEEVRHWIDNELRETFVLYYRIHDIELYFEDMEMHDTVTIQAFGFHDELLFQDSIDTDDLRGMVDLRNNGWAHPVDATIAEMQEAAKASMNPFEFIEHGTGLSIDLDGEMFD